MLLMVSEHILVCLTLYMMNESIKQCKYPSRWKMGQVTPLFKKNDELSKENYRPVTALPALNNVFEKLLASQLDQFYLTIRLRARVFYEQIVNEAQPS